MLDIQIKNIHKNTFSLKNDNELLHIVNSKKYHIIIFNKNCECEINFKSCKVKERQLFFANTSDVFLCKTKGNINSHFSFSYEVFDNNHCETKRLIKGLLFDNLLSSTLLKLSREEFLKFESQLNKIIVFQAKDDSKNLKIVFKEIITQAIVKKHKQFFAEEKISKNHQTIYKYLSLVNEHFKMEHNVFVYAQILRIQSKIITKIFSDLKIKNPKSYLNKRILLAAKTTLAYSSKKSTEISYEIGFNDPAYFARFFKRNTGLTPKQFRMQKTSN